MNSLGTESRPLYEILFPNQQSVITQGFSRIFHILPLDGLMYSEDTHILGEVQGNNQVCDCATKRVERTGVSLSGSREPQTVTLLGKAASADMVKLQISS